MRLTKIFKETSPITRRLFCNLAYGVVQNFIHKGHLKIAKTDAHGQRQRRRLFRKRCVEQTGKFGVVNARGAPHFFVDMTQIKRFCRFPLRYSHGSLCFERSKPQRRSRIHLSRQDFCIRNPYREVRTRYDRSDCTGAVYLPHALFCAVS